MGVDLFVVRKNEFLNFKVREQLSLNPAEQFEDHHSRGGALPLRGPDQSGLRVMAACSANLSELAEKLGVKNLDDFFDPARAEFQFYEEWHGEEAPEGWLEEHCQWFTPDEAVKTLRAFIAHFKESGQDLIVPQVEYLEALDPLLIVSPYTPVILDPPPVKVEDLLADLEECLNMLQIIEKENDLFYFEVSV